MRIRLTLCLFLMIAAVLAIPHRAQAATFSADLTVTQNGRAHSGKIYVRDNAIRQELRLKNEVQITIIRLDQKLVWTLQTANRTFLETAYLGTQTDLQSYGIKTEDIRETRTIGIEQLNGYRCTVIQYRFNDPKIMMTQWIATKLNFTIKTEIHGVKGFNLTQELKNIVETPAADTVFEIPAGYQKISFTSPDTP
ncbi:uncharacterized protein DUF4412 [Hydrogenispora ethanolica]|jgi:hypothetical protein|uniref:Uncharacterized protein DUF4412 n=1 Tax=Hydrogenispora ethanolica TaxID=1082276 RepID=A0A4R1RFM0_HYDET|nr:DUF4412 domain-containing protein [Hydrogenispora ethanolica]TCL64778.1 uncharacterized protein DUF4412 [Hydrogenispora ethanolica]